MLITCKNFSCNFLKIGNIFATSNQPVVIKIGDRTIETIGEKIQLMGSYGRTVSADGRVNKLRG